MNFPDFLHHALGFVASAVAVAVWVALCAPYIFSKPAAFFKFIEHAAINSIAGVLALLFSLVVFGRDGTMAGYALMVLAIATSEWICLQAWRR